MADGSRILLVEDDPALAREIVRALERDHWPIDHVGSLAEAFEAVIQFPYRAILLDRRLPDGDGIGLIPAAKSRPSAPAIIFLTARDDLADRVEGLDAGADDYLVKPFALEELLARLRAACRRPGQGAKPVPISVARLAFDPATREVSAGGRTIALPRRELALARAPRPPRRPGGPARASPVRALRLRRRSLDQRAGDFRLPPAPPPRRGRCRGRAPDGARRRLHASAMLRRTPSLALRAGLIFMSIYTIIFLAFLAVALSTNSAEPVPTGTMALTQLSALRRRAIFDEASASFKLADDGYLRELAAKNPSLWLIARQRRPVLFLRLGAAAAAPASSSNMADVIEAGSVQAARTSIVRSGRCVDAAVRPRLPHPLALAAGGVDPATLDPAGLRCACSARKAS